jgi:hypothetical protein
MADVRAAARLLAASALALLCVGCAGQPDALRPSGASDPSSTTEVSDANTGASASCVGPYLDDQPPSGTFMGPMPTVTPGATITVYGHWYTSTCNDTGGHDPLKPLPPVHLTLAWPDGDEQRLGPFRPGGDDLGFSVAVRVPATTRPGIARLHDDRQPAASFAFKVAARTPR